MAEGLARHRFGNNVRVQSAGSSPCTVNPFAIEVMREKGIDIRAHRSTSVDEVAAGDIDLVITLCAEEVCPSFLDAVDRQHWPLEDPAPETPRPREEMLRRFRATRDALDRHLVALQASWNS